jgi:hypothetical protein
MLFRVLTLAGLLGSASLGLVGLPGCGDDGGFPSDAYVADAAAPGTVQLTWVIKDLAGNVTSCDKVGADSVSLELRRVDDASGTPDSFSCASGTATSRAVPAGHYRISIALGGARLAPVAGGDQQVTIVAGGTTPLAPVAFTVDATGGLALTFAVPMSANNCAATGMTGVTIKLTHVEGGCEPVTFGRAGGADTTPYTIQCAAPSVAPCLETTEILTATAPVPSGQYDIEVRGRKGATECWVNNNRLVVPAQGQLHSELLNLAFLNDAPGC